LLHEHCGQKWRHFISPCDVRHAEHLVDIFWLMPMGTTYELEKVYNANSVCSVPQMYEALSMTGGRCSRTVVDVMTPLLLHQATVEATLLPILILMAWALSTNDKSGSLQLHWVGLRTSRSRPRYLQSLDKWGELAVSFGPFAPFLQIVLLVSVLINVLMCRLQMFMLGDTELQTLLGQGIKKKN